MKRLFSVLLILVGFAIVIGFCGCVTQSGQLAPVTMEIVEEAKAKSGGGNPEILLGQLKYYLSAPLTLLKNDHDRDFRPINGVLHIEEKNKSTDTKILSSYKGELYKFDYGEGEECFVILFKEGKAIDVSLKFKRDKEKNWFVLDSVVKPENYTLSSDGIRPYLCIMLNYINEKSIPFYHSISSAAQGIPDLPGSNSKTWSPPPSRNIIADGVLTKESIVGFIKSKNTSITSGMIENIVNTYTDEAKKENINLDIAIAQMCEGTDFLNNLNRLVTNNYGDLHDIKNTKLRASFPSMETGIRAHIQQLKYYASPSGLAYPAVDQPRLTRIEKNRGKYTTLDQLFSVWVSVNHNAYKNRINEILSEMYNFRSS